VKIPRQTRRYRRRTVRVHVEYDAPDGTRDATATTLGAGGMFIATDNPLDEHSQILVRFQLEPQGLVHEIQGRVVWANRPDDAHSHTRGMGIEFKNPAACSQLARELEGLKPAERS